MFYSRFTKLCNELNLKPQSAEIRNVSGVSSAAITGWKSGSMPKADALLRLADYFNVSVDYLLGKTDLRQNNVVSYSDLSSDERALLDYFNELNSDGQSRVTDYARVLIASGMFIQAKEPAQLKILQFLQPVSAGTGSVLDYGYADEVLIPESPLTKQASFIVRVSGNSMEPTYHDGDRLLVKKTSSIDQGEVGIFYLDGKGYVKTLGDGVLISINPSYPDIVVTSDIRCFGKVIGVLGENHPKGGKGV